MAEFGEVMKQWRRFCKSHGNCGECEFDGKGICGETHMSEVPFADIELRIMAWAAEHPEPKYPTWVEWLELNGIVTEPRDEAIQEVLQSLFPELPNRLLTFRAYRAIPADIAQKLGIEPKEGM